MKLYNLKDKLSPGIVYKVYQIKGDIFSKILKTFSSLIFLFTS
jgi:hypothetical protein